MGEDFLGDFGPQEVHYPSHTLMPQHHLLVVALDLMRVSGLHQPGQVAEDLNPLPVLLGINYLPKVGQISDIGVVLKEVPAIEAIVALLFLENFKEPPTLDLDFLFFFYWLLNLYLFLWFLFHSLNFKIIMKSKVINSQKLQINKSKQKRSVII